MKGVGAIPPPHNETLHQVGTRGLLWKETNDRLKAHLLDIASVFGASRLNHSTILLVLPLPAKGVVEYKKGEKVVRFMIQMKFKEYGVLMHK